MRAAWRAMLSELDTRELVFVDEMGSHTSLVPLYAYSPKGCRAHVEVPRNRGPNTTLLSSMSVEGMGPSLAVEAQLTVRSSRHMWSGFWRLRSVEVRWL